MKEEKIFSEELDTQSENVFSILPEEEDTPIITQDGDELPVLMLRNMVLFPFVIMPITVGRPKSLRLIKKAYESESEFFVATQVDANIENPGLDELYPVGTIAKVIRTLEMPDGTTTAILMGRTRATLMSTTATSENPYFTAPISIIEEDVPDSKDRIFQALIEAIKDMAVKIIKKAVTNEEIAFALRNINTPRMLLNFISGNFNFKLPEKIKLLEQNTYSERGTHLLDLMTRENQLLDIKRTIQDKAKSGIDKQQREYFLHQQLKTIQEELGEDGNPDLAEIAERTEKKKWSEEVQKTFIKEFNKIKRMPTQSPDYNIMLNYLNTMLDLPWDVQSKDKIDLKRAQKVLDQDHYGLQDVKERILEHLAVMKMAKMTKKNNNDSPIICLYGPPGVGKTSLGKSVARALNREYVRMSFGGLHDESEIRGHRRTYIGALPGRIIKGMIKAGTNNPVFVLDEIDKISADFKGDPSAALLEVLDPEQNQAFHDNFLDMDYDLSNVLFIATANNISNIAQPLLDRMEMINISGYVTEEKVEIGMRHLFKKELKSTYLEDFGIKIQKSAMQYLIENYTREAGVRGLDKTINKLLRKTVKEFLADEEQSIKMIKKADVTRLLGAPTVTHDTYDIQKYYGVVTGLAWTSVGGEILFVEAAVNEDKGSKLTLTGNLGNVMKESATLALEYLKSNHQLFGIDTEVFNKHSVHIHVPEGAIPKDGPSAGISILCAMVSAFTKQKVRNRWAMTGEITLRGKLLPVGGIKEKVLAAKRAGIKNIMLCQENKKDIDKIDELYLKGLEFHFMEDMADAVKLAVDGFSTK